VLHPPQLEVVVSGVSQPVASLPSQSPKPLLHDAMLHVPVAHVAVANARPQLVPHAPQLTSVVSGVSQPLPGTLSQSPKPTLHATRAHTPPAQLVAAFVRAHGTPQPPQSVSVSSGSSQPLFGFRSQSAKPESQASTVHRPLVHAGVAFVSAHA
jgi:hypothetical protein